MVVAVAVVVETRNGRAARDSEISVPERTLAHGKLQYCTRPADEIRVLGKPRRFDRRLPKVSHSAQRALSANARRGHDSCRGRNAPGRRRQSRPAQICEAPREEQLATN
jgi:hypothetical protein